MVTQSTRHCNQFLDVSPAFKALDTSYLPSRHLALALFHLHKHSPLQHTDVPWIYSGTDISILQPNMLQLSPLHAWYFSIGFCHTAFSAKILQMLTNCIAIHK